MQHGRPMPETECIAVPVAEFRKIQDRNEYIGALLEAINLKDQGAISSKSITRMTRLAQLIAENNEAALSSFGPH